MVKGYCTLAAVFFLFVISLSFAQASSLNLELEQIGNKVFVSYTIELDNQKTLAFPIPADAMSISSNPDYYLKDNVLHITGKSIELSYVTQETLESSDSGFYLINTIRFNLDYDNATIILHLDEGSFIDKDKIFPKPSDITTDGTHIDLIWVIGSTKEKGDMPLFVAINTRTSGISFLPWLIIILLIAAVSYLSYYFYSKLEKSKPKEESDKYLIESEKTVLNILRKADRGEMWQKELQLKTGFSKAKLSRMVRNLESRNLVEKISFGNTNKVRLK